MAKYAFFSGSLFLLCCSQPVLADTQQIPTVIVNSDPTDSVSSNAFAQTNVITHEQIAASGAKNIAEVLQGQPDVQLQDFVGDGSNVTVSMRGFGDDAASNALIMLDGVPLSNPDLQAAALNTIAIENIDHIDIIPASEGTLLGDQAVGGVINIVTRNPQKFAVNLKGGSGSYNQYLTQIDWQNVFDDGVSYLASVKNDANENYRQHNVDRQTNLFGKLNYQYQTGTVDTTYQFNQQSLLLAGALTAQQLADNRRLSANLTDDTDADEQFIHIKNRQWLSSDWQAETDVSHRNAISNSSYFMFPYRQVRAVNELAPTLIGRWNNVVSRTGVDLMGTNYKVLDSSLTDTQQREDVYTQFTVPLREKVKLQLGARDAGMKENLISQNNSYAAFVKTAGVTWQVNPMIELYTRRDESFRFPKADESTAIPANITRLKTQTGVSYEAGVTAHQAAWSGKINIYQLNLKNEIVFDPTSTPAQPFGANTNLDPTQRRGSTLQSTYQLTQRFSLGGQYSYVDARFSEGPDANNHVPFVAQNTYTLFSKYLFNEQWSGYVEDVFTGSRYQSGDVSNATNKLAPFSLINFSLNFQRQKFTAALRVNNFFNTRYNSFAVFEPSDDASSFYPAPERNFLLTVGYQFV